jgi:hypothetical protein
MPRIIIETDGSQQHAPAVTLLERLVPADARTDHYLDQLVERVGWAVLDAEELEAAAAAAAAPAASHRRRRVVNPRVGDPARRPATDRRRESARRAAQLQS